MMFNRLICCFLGHDRAFTRETRVLKPQEPGTNEEWQTRYCVRCKKIFIKTHIIYSHALRQVLASDVNILAIAEGLEGSEIEITLTCEKTNAPSPREEQKGSQ